MSITIEVETDRLALRKFIYDDIDFLVSMESDGEVMKNTGPAKALSKVESRVRLDKIINDYSESSEFGVWAVVLKNSNQLIGWFMYKPTELKFPEIGYMFPQKLWGNGYATEIVEGVFSFLKTQEGALGISARTNKVNKASIKVLTKNGMTSIKPASVNDSMLCYFELSLHKTDTNLI